MPPPKRKKKAPAPKLATGVKPGAMKQFARVMLSQVGLFVIVTAYAVGGAYTFMSIESTTDELNNFKKEAATEMVHQTKRYIALDMWLENKKNHTAERFKEIALGNLQGFHRFIVQAATESSFDGTDSQHQDWTFSNALLFTVTTMGAIGYGHISPKTFKGQVYCIFYGIVGVPLLLVFLASIGDFLANTTRYIYSRGCCVVCRMIRKKSEVLKGMKPQSVFKEKVGQEPYMPTEDVQVPITVSVCILAVYLMGGGVLFMLWEEWMFHQAGYFSFITLSTIGFGDLVPGSSFDVSGGNSVVALFKMAVTVLYVLIGMALLSMCINLIQEQIVAKFRWLAQELGMGDSDGTPAEQKYRKIDYDVMMTPEDKDGNKKCSLENLDEPKPLRKIRRPQSRDSGGLKFTDVSE